MPEIIRNHPQNIGEISKKSNCEFFINFNNTIQKTRFFSLCDKQPRKYAFPRHLRLANAHLFPFFRNHSLRRSYPLRPFITRPRRALVEPPFSTFLRCSPPLRLLLVAPSPRRVLLRFHLSIVLLRFHLSLALFSSAAPSVRCLPPRPNLVTLPLPIRHSSRQPLSACPHSVSLSFDTLSIRSSLPHRRDSRRQPPPHFKSRSSGNGARKDRLRIISHLVCTVLTTFCLFLNCMFILLVSNLLV